MPQNCLEGLLKRVTGPRFPIHLVYGGAQKRDFLTTSQVVFMLLMQGPHFENHCSRKSSYQISGMLESSQEFSLLMSGSHPEKPLFNQSRARPGYLDFF